MGRFDRKEPSELPQPLGEATQSLRVTVEEKLREIIEAAEARAHEIEDRALEQSLEIEQDSERKARQRFKSSTDHAQQLVAAVDALEREIKEALGTLRAKAKALNAELGAQAPPDPAAAPPEPKTSDATADAPADQREGVRKRVLDMFLAGKPRVEAERMLTQMQDGGQYTDLLDEVYEPRSETQQGTAPRRGGRRRRRPGS